MSNPLVPVTSRLAVGTLAATLAVGLAAGPGVAAASSGTLSRAQTEEGLMTPGLAADAHGGQVLVGVAIDGGKLKAFQRDGHGAWQDETTLAGAGEHVTAPTVQMSANGWAAAAWESKIGGALHVRLRRPGGAWLAERTFKKVHVWGNPQVALNDRGDVVVAPDDMSGDSHVALRRKGKWHVINSPLFGPPVVGMDDSGVVYAVASDAERGSAGEAWIAKYGRAGRWSHATKLPMPRTVRDVQIEVAPRGALTVAGGYVSKKWRSTSDTATYWPTAYRVLRATKWGATWKRLWQRQGVPNLSLASAGNGVQLTWEKWLGRHKRLPTRRRLLTQTVAPHAGAAVTIAGSKTSERRASYVFNTALAASGQASLVWRSEIGSQRGSDPVHVVGVSASGTVTSAVAAASQSKDWYDTAPQVVADGTAAWVAHAQDRHTRNYGWVLKGGEVATGQLTAPR